MLLKLIGGLVLAGLLGVGAYYLITNLTIKKGRRK